jgi:UDP-N-acetyl-2-amino-2-deoxyglucuronate dehydrogenase
LPGLRATPVARLFGLAAMTPVAAREPDRNGWHHVPADAMCHLVLLQGSRAEMSKHKVAVVGAGVIGSWHAQTIAELEGAELACVIDVDHAAADAAAEKYMTTAYYSLDSALDGPDEFDIVAVCVPSGLHAEIAVRALQAGKHAIVEKPIEVTLEAADRIVAAQRSSGLLATVIHQHRFDRSSQIMMEAISSGKLGRITSALVSCAWWRAQSYYDSAAWRGTRLLDGGGALMNQGVHVIELLIAALGRPAEVFAYTGCLAHERIEVEDVGVAAVRFESGALATILSTTSAFPGLSTRLQVHGDRGSVVIEDDNLAFIHATAGEQAEASAGSAPDPSNQLAQHGAAPAGPAAASDPRQLSDSHHRQYENFLDALDGKADLLVSLDQARLAVELTLAIYESAHAGRPVPIRP